jgi:hypothetical protein
MLQLLWKTVGQFPQNLNAELVFDLVIPLPGIYPRELETNPLIKTKR